MKKRILKGLRLAIVAGTYHSDVRKSIEVVKSRAAECGAQILTVVEVPGAFEMPLQVSRLLRDENIDGIVTLGAIERGETGHGMVLGMIVLNKLLELGIEHDKPVGLGVIGPNATREQISSRAARIAKESVDAVLVALSKPVKRR